MDHEVLFMDPGIPQWACSDYGKYEHDWLDCCQCMDNYETWLFNMEDNHVLIDPSTGRAKE
jgi:hypothetical protein